MSHEMLDAVPLWGVAAVVGVLLMLAVEAGYRVGRWRHAHVADEKEAPVGAMVAAILGLLAFLLAFTFSLAASRFEARRQVVLDEANAIGTTWLRARFLPEPQRSEAEKLLREYVDTRLRGVQPGQLAEAIARSEQLHTQLWSQATAAAEKNPGSIMTGLFVQSLNDVIDLHAARVLVGVRSRIPISIWAGLLAIAIVGMASVGYQAGLSATRRSPAMLLLVLAFVGVLFLIADLDRGQEGFLRVSQAAMTDLQKTIEQGGASDATR
jgi:hypothetical protein